MQFVKKITGWNNPGWGGTAKIRASNALLGYSLHKLDLALNGKVEMVKSVKVVLNDNEIIRLKIDQLLHINRYNKSYSDANYNLLSIPFGDQSAKSERGQAHTSLCILPNDVLIFEIEWNERPKLTDGSFDSTFGETPQMDSFMEVSINQNIVGDVIVRPRTLIIQDSLVINNQIGEIDIIDFPNDSLIEIRRMHLFGGNISKIEFMRGDKMFMNPTKAINEFNLKRYDKAPQDNCFTVDFVANGWHRMNYYPTVGGQTLNMKVTTTKAENITILWEKIRIDHPEPNLI